MQLRIGTKVVKSKPMTRGEYNDYRGWFLPENENPADRGFLVEYMDGGTPNHPDHAGYISWSPEEQFLNAYRPMVGMTFGAATEAMKVGMKVTRAGWNGKDMWIAIGAAHPGLEAEKFWNPHARSHAEQRGGTCPVQQYFLMKTAQGDIQMGWSPTGSDALAEDWLTVP